MRWHIPMSAFIMDLLLFVPLYTRCKYNHTDRKTKLMVKGLCSGYALVILLVGCVDLYTLGVRDSYALILLLGMTLCFIGDLVLEVKFLIGGFFFGFGHLCYITVLFLLNDGKITLISLFSYFIIMVPGLILTLIKLSKKYRPALISYNLVISFSFALSIPLVMSGSMAKTVAGTGAILLVVSDWILARNKTYGSNFFWSLLSLELYFGGQLFIASYPYFINFL